MNKKYRTKFYIVSFLILPAIFIFGFIITIKIFNNFIFVIDYKGKVIICAVLAISYLRCLKVLKNKFNEL